MNRPVFGRGACQSAIENKPVRCSQDEKSAPTANIPLGPWVEFPSSLASQYGYSDVAAIAPTPCPASAQ